MTADRARAAALRALDSGIIPREMLGDMLTAGTRCVQREATLRRFKLDVDGIPGPQTVEAWRAMNSESGSTGRPPRPSSYAAATRMVGLDKVAIVDDPDKPGWLAFNNPDGTSTPYARWWSKAGASFAHGGRTVWMHRSIAAHAHASVDAATAAAGWGPSRIGGHAARHVLSSPSAGLSMHAHGLALDCDPRLNAWGVPIDSTSLGAHMVWVETMEAMGWSWGGQWTRQGPDAMHFEWVG